MNTKDIKHREQRRQELQGADPGHAGHPLREQLVRPRRRKVPQLARLPAQGARSAVRRLAALHQQEHGRRADGADEGGGRGLVREELRGGFGGGVLRRPGGGKRGKDRQLHRVCFESCKCYKMSFTQSCTYCAKNIRYKKIKNFIY